ncbi:aryl-alcohol dehydrogenase-like predicted oxidoreductase [Friedmanniella endophytica]|uniref:Aryl-alcohol dehydrogenase-like predicted oxidoreductase n=1 Tax=Microlunatus kandeliicorticis TaxID=1759536 RepID=A0A7W3P4A4_9ACTN|nr:oxidoreductase [Microlunatus kandeliicorticis]MBA8792658.1 aryl-alcohol dehydrogenase-like predicted oxidoreductase [Microlunatus kandeliicorticis]
MSENVSQNDDQQTYPLAGHRVHRVGFGAMQLPGPGVMGPPRDHDQAIAVLRRAVELGVDHIDTAQFYGPNVANKLIHEALHPYPDDLVLVSKVGAVRDDAGNWLMAQAPDQLRQGVEDNLRTLEVEQLGAVNLRLPDAAHRGPEDAEIPLEDKLAAMAALRDEGKIAGIGISTASLEEVRTAHESVGLVCVQNAFSLADRSDRPVLDYCLEQGIAYVPYFPLGSAFPGMPKVSEQPQAIDVAQRLGHSPAQVGLAWLLALAPNTLLIPGTSSPDHLEENLAVAGIRLSAEDVAELEQIGG